MGVKSKTRVKRKAKPLPRMEQLRRMVKGRRLTMRTASFRKAEKKLVEEIIDPYHMSNVKKVIEDLIERKKGEKERKRDIPDAMFVSAEIKYLRNLLRGPEWLKSLNARKERWTRQQVKEFMETPPFTEWVEREVLDSIRTSIGDYLVMEDLTHARQDLIEESKNLLIENLSDLNNRVEHEARLQFLADIISSQAKFKKFLRKYNIIG